MTQSHRIDPWNFTKQPRVRKSLWSALWMAVLGVAGSPAAAGTYGAAVSVQHRKVAQLGGSNVQYREGGPGLVLTARGDGRFAPQARLDLAQTHLESGDEHWMARLELERQHGLGPFVVGSRMSFETEGRKGYGACSNRVEFSPTAGVRFDAGRARVRVHAGVPALGVMARRGRTALDPHLLDAEWARSVAIPAALYATGPWNAPAIDLTGRATLALAVGEAWVSVRTTVDRLDIDVVEQRVMTVQPEVGYRWGGAKKDRGQADRPGAWSHPPVILPPLPVPPWAPVAAPPEDADEPEELSPSDPPEAPEDPGPEAPVPADPPPSESPAADGLEPSPAASEAPVAPVPAP